jgi:peptide chain release factor
VGVSVQSIGAESEDQLSRRMRLLGVMEADFEETFVRSGGRGGQNVNKTSTCVWLVHRPSGLRVKCQASRQQGMNRVLARHRLLDKLVALRQLRVAAQRAEAERLRRQKRPRSRAAKERILADKARRSRKKLDRRVVAG